MEYDLVTHSPSLTWDFRTWKKTGDGSVEISQFLLFFWLSLIVASQWPSFKMNWKSRQPEWCSPSKVSFLRAQVEVEVEQPKKAHRVYKRLCNMLSTYLVFKPWIQEAKNKWRKMIQSCLCLLRFSAHFASDKEKLAFAKENFSLHKGKCPKLSFLSLERWL